MRCDGETYIQLNDRLSIRDGQTVEQFKIPAMPLQMHFTVLLIVVWIYSQGII